MKVAAERLAVFPTLLFAAPVVKSADPAREVVLQIQAERKRRGLPALQRDGALDQIAQEEAASAARGGEAKLSGETAGRALAKVPSLHSALAELFVGGGPDVVTHSKNLAEPRWTRLGAGTVYAGSKAWGAGALWVVLLYGR